MRLMIMGTGVISSDCVRFDLWDSVSRIRGYARARNRIADDGKVLRPASQNRSVVRMRDD